LLRHWPASSMLCPAYCKPDLSTYLTHYLPLQLDQGILCNTPTGVQD
jgi:hypothetical protein